MLIKYTIHMVRKKCFTFQVLGGKKMCKCKLLHMGGEKFRKSKTFPKLKFMQIINKFLWNPK